MIGKPGSPALLGMAVLSALVLGACGGGGPSLHFVTVTPASGTVYFSTGVAGGAKGAQARATRKGAVVASPQDITNASCRSQQFNATAFFSDGTTMDETNSVTWTSSNTSVANVSPNGNAFATGSGVGTVTIGATFNTVVATPASLEVDQLNSISMNPPSANIASGGSQQFVANGNFTLASGAAAQQPIVATQLTWMSNNTNLVTVDQNGNATSTGNGPGTVTITATTCDGAQGMATLTVGAPAVTLQITPATPTIAAGTTIAFTSVMHSDGTPVTNPITWQSGNTSVVTIDPNSGLALGVASGGPITITGTESVTGLMGSTTVTVSAAAARYAYAGNLASQDISSYTVNVANGTFTPLATTPAAVGSRQVLLHPSGDFLYYIDDGCSLHSMFIDSTSGALTLTPQPVPGTSGQATCVGAIDPLGRFIYTVSGENNAIYGFSITQPTAQTGKTGATVAALTTIPGFGAPNGYTDATLNFPNWILIDPTGSFLYVLNNLGAGSISQYAINADGTLSPLSPATVPAGNGTTNNPFYGCIDRHGNLFVANLGASTTDETVSGFKITASGQLATLGPDVLIANGNVSAVAIVNVIASPVADYMYVLDADSAGNGQVFAYTYTIGASTFTLTPVGSTTPTGNSPDGMAIDPTGSLLAIDNTAFNPGPPTGSVSLYTITPSGASAGGLTVANGGNPAPAGTSTHFVSYYTALSGQ